jgi:16S rRNA (cytosine1402-N4)-methyltransferase
MTESGVLTTARFAHASVLADEVVQHVPERVSHFADVTLGGGGHAERILRERKPAHFLGLDRDAQALAASEARLAEFSPVLRRARFSQLPNVMRELAWPQVDGVLADLGVSSPQLDQADRGFSFMRRGPLDMRMGEGETLGEKLANASEEELADVIFQLGEERFARRVARAMVRDREQIVDTHTLAQVVRSALPKSPGGIDPATRTFQALRIWVNDELGELSTLLAALPEILADDGVALIISFHSLEDRAVKQAFNDAAKGCICPPKLPVCRCGQKPTMAVVTRKPLTATPEECERNPRARSAKLRVARRLPR